MNKESATNDTMFSSAEGPISSSPAAVQVDAKGLRCPLPILRAKKALSALESGQVVDVLTTDPSAAQDFQAFCRQTGNHLLAQEEQADGALRHTIRRR